MFGGGQMSYGRHVCLNNDDETACRLKRSVVFLFV